MTDLFDEWNTRLEAEGLGVIVVDDHWHSTYQKRSKRDGHQAHHRQVEAP